MSEDTPGLPSQPVNPGVFDLDAWIDGTCGVITTAKIYKRGDLFPEIERLQRELDIAKKTKKDQRGVDDRGPEAIEQELAELAEQWSSSAMTVYVQDRTEVRRQGIRERVKKQHKLDDTKYEDRDTLALHVLADSIVKAEVDGQVTEFPDGFPVNQLRRIRDNLGDSALLDTWDAFNKVTTEAPHVSAPLSRTSSSDRGGIT